MCFAWVMALAIPLQGMAASTMLSCGPSHDRMAQGMKAGALELASSQTGGFGHNTMDAGHGVHVHLTAEHPAADELATGVDAYEVTGPFQHHGKFSCSACAICCPGHAPPASFVLPAPSGPARLAPMPPAVPAASHQPDGLDRPPRIFLA